MTFPLLSVCIISYNSSRTITDTLNSVLRQDYPQIELIVSDDGSKDGTVEISREWLSRHQDKFVCTSLLTVEKNTGIAPNFNRACKAARGEWIKLIAADDVLLPHCLSDNWKQVSGHPHIQVLLSNVIPFQTTAQGEVTQEVRPTPQEAEFFTSSAAGQMETLLIHNPIPCAPSAFYKRSALAGIGFSDERYAFVEDYPLWFHFTRAGIKLDYMPVATVKYRCEESITRNKQSFINPRYFQSIRKFYTTELFPLYPAGMKWIKWHMRLYFSQMWTAIHLFRNKPAFFSRTCLKLFLLLDPFYLNKRLRRRK